MNWSELQSARQQERGYAARKREQEQETTLRLVARAKEELLTTAKIFLDEEVEIKPKTTVDRFLANILFLIRIHEQCPSLNEYLHRTRPGILFGPWLKLEVWHHVVLSENGVLFRKKPPYDIANYVEFSPALTDNLWDSAEGNLLIAYFARLPTSKILEKIWKSLGA